MATDTGRIAAMLKEMVDKNSPGYLADEPYAVFEELIASGVAKKRTAGAILYFLVSGMLERLDEDRSFDDLSKEIQKTCSFNKKMADMLASIFLSLYSPSNREEWKSMDLQGLERFRNTDLLLEWNGFATWDAGSVSIDCHYEAEIELKAAGSLVVDNALSAMLEKNPFMTAKEIWNYYSGNLTDHLDQKFDWYCTCEEYYEPVVEDFELEYYAKDWCEKNGFELIRCEGEGDDSGYIPRDVRRYLR